MRVRSLLAVAESSEFTAEAQAFTSKAQRLAAEHGIPPALLRFPREPLQVAVVIAELQRIQTLLEHYDGAEELWATKSAEWSSCLDEYDEVLEAAAELVQLPVPRLPYGSRRHFRPDERAQIEALIRTKAR
ncbi:MAG TPA: DUF2786 domain-containing protein [Acidimicrobiales bacterium]|nr:DUF2786 domain-containing protein [Acidimicrobiales bacterium]